MAVSFVYGRLEIVDKPDAGIGERDERIYCRKFNKFLRCGQRPTVREVESGGEAAHILLIEEAMECTGSR